MTAALGLDADAIVACWQSAEGHAAAGAANTRARTMGMTTYPSMFLRQGPDRLAPLLEGFATAAQIVAVVTDATARPVTLLTRSPLPLH